MKPDVYGKDGILGAFSDDNLDRIEDVYGIKVEKIDGHFNIGPKEAVFVICAWKGDMGNIHWVRLLRMDDEFVFFMNPLCDVMPDKIDKREFIGWFKRLYKIRKIT